MSTPRYQNKRTPGTLKKAVADLVSAAGGIVRAGDLLGIGKSQVQRYTDEQERDDMTVRQVRTLEQVTRTPFVTTFLAHESGHVLLPVDFESGDANLNADLAALGSTSQKLFGNYHDYLVNDGVLDEQERRLLAQDADRILCACAAMRATLLAGLQEEG